jgi:hypothetical protein
MKKKRIFVIKLGKDFLIATQKAQMKTIGN